MIVKPVLPIIAGFIAMCLPVFPHLIALLLPILALLVPIARRLLPGACLATGKPIMESVPALFGSSGGELARPALRQARQWGRGGTHRGGQPRRRHGPCHRRR